MKKSYLLTLIFINITLLSGCASIEKGRTQKITVETTYNQQPEPGATCMLANPQGKWTVTTPQEVTIRRSHKNLEILCEKEGFTPGKLSVQILSHKKMLAKSVLVGGMAGAGLDHLNGALYDYPSPIKVPLTK